MSTAILEQPAAAATIVGGLERLAEGAGLRARSVGAVTLEP
jgi:hypothetical protein